LRYKFNKILAGQPTISVRKMSLCKHSIPMFATR